MRPQLKPLDQQVIVITGASSGHGLATAKEAAKAGARVVLVARDEDALRRIRDEIRGEGGQAEYVAADVGDEAQVQRVADFAVERFGGFDTWVNNAGVGIYGELVETPIADHRQLFETNYWGVVYGSLAAVRHLRNKEGGGALINVGSINSDIASPLLGAYNASKHAVKGFTNSLRIEMLEADLPVQVTLIKPSAIGTPFPEHGRNLTGSQARLPPPVYAPEIVADAILYAAQHPRRAITVGMAGRAQVFGQTVAPTLFDRIASLMRPTLVDKSEPVGKVDGNLYAPAGNDGHVRGPQKGRPFSLYTAAETHPAVVAGVAVLVAVGVGALLGRKPIARTAGRAAMVAGPALLKARSAGGRELGRLSRRAAHAAEIARERSGRQVERLRARF